MPNILLNAKRQIEVDHSGVYLRQFRLEFLGRFVQGLEDQGQLTENVRINDCSHEYSYWCDDCQVSSNRLGICTKGDQHNPS